MSTTRAKILLVASLVLVVGWFAMPGFTGATFTASSENVGTIKAADDWTPPTVSLNSVTDTLSGTQTISASASDGETGVASVRIQYAPAGSSTWTTICTDSSTPYSCSWNTAQVSDGDYKLRATATDNAGYTSDSDILTTTVANALQVVMTDPGSPVSGTVSVSAKVLNSGYPYTQLSIQYRPAGGTWTTLPGCGTTAKQVTCTLSTAGYTGTADVRALAYVGYSNTPSSMTQLTDTITGVVIDNTAPIVSMTNPGTPLSGTVTLAATASDATTSVASVAIQRSLSGASSWTTVCTDNGAPWSCNLDTTALTEGARYDFRAVATDSAGNTATSATVTSKVINAAMAISLDEPADWVKGTVTLTADAYATAGVKNVAFQRATRGSSTYTTICTDTVAPYSCSWATSGVGDYDLRAVVTDNSSAPAQMTSAVVQVSVDNTALAGYDIQSSNTSGTLGKVDSGDRIVYTYNGAVDLDTVSSGWAGAAKGVTVSFTDTYNSGYSTDSFTVPVTSLGAVRTTSNIVSSQRSFNMSGTMVASTTTVGGNTATVITITLSGSTSAYAVTGTSSATSYWMPSSNVQNFVGTPSSTSTVTELGTSDRDF